METPCRCSTTLGGSTFTRQPISTCRPTETLAYISQYPPSHLVWVDREGSEERLDAKPGSYANPQLSPDGRRLVVSIAEESRDLWIYELSAGTADRLAHESVAEEIPIWTPDGRHVIYARGELSLDIYRKPADGSGEAILVRSSDYDLYAEDVSPDGRWLIFREDDPDTDQDLWVVSIEGQDEPTQFVHTAANESTARFSPDGRSVAYTSDDSGRVEIYVREFPGAGKTTARIR